MPATTRRPSPQRQARSDGTLKHLQTWLDARVWRRARVAAIRREMTVSAWVAEAITHHLDRRPQ